MEERNLTFVAVGTAIGAAAGYGYCVYEGGRTRMGKEDISIYVRDYFLRFAIQLTIL